MSPPSKLVAADFSGSGATSLSCSCPPGAHGARLLGFSISGAKLSRTTLWSTTRAPFSVASTPLAAGDLTGAGKADLLLFSQLRTAASLRGFLSSGTKLAPHWHWAGHLPAGTQLACGVASGSAKFAAWLLSPTSASKAALTARRPPVAALPPTAPGRGPCACAVPS